MSLKKKKSPFSLTACQPVVIRRIEPRLFSFNNLQVLARVGGWVCVNGRSNRAVQNLNSLSRWCNSRLGQTKFLLFSSLQTVATHYEFDVNTLSSSYHKRENVVLNGSGRIGGISISQWPHVILLYRNHVLKVCLSNMARRYKDRIKLVRDG